MNVYIELFTNTFYFLSRFDYLSTAINGYNVVDSLFVYYNYERRECVTKCLNIYLFSFFICIYPL